MANPGDPGDEAGRVARLAGELLAVLAEKVRAAGPESVRVLTEEELQRHQLNWFRAGWEEHARATGLEGQARPGGGAAGHPDSEDFPVPPSARLLHFPLPQRPLDDEGGDGDGDGHGGGGGRA
ncbi:hypothetical protein [Streptomyces sp. NBC_00878]|uniref:hypothetical protein n=1 Tax=Streptomyces sp. NBC_00878 TaxID=2975854 RepID=UPI002251A5B5|nr:hypothetical protein [Streptomyces sp. NBC_00878]MCX4907531.1 hypothetical protein [Streptomyces sp. NBC_00878]